MIDKAVLQEIPGGRALIDWFGYVPGFHDAELLEVTLSSKGPSMLRIHAWNMTSTVDDQGYFGSDKHVDVTIMLDQVTHVDLADFNVEAIIFDLDITKIVDEDSYQLAWTASHGVVGTLRAGQVRFDIRPHEPG